MTAGIARAPEPDLDTAWRSGRLDARRSRARLLFGKVYEDSAIERSAFPAGTRVFCIASAGCTALSLCEEHEVVACDINPAQIEYLKRRLAGGPPELGMAEKIMGFMRRLALLAGWSRTKLLAFLTLDEPGAQLSFFKNQLDTRRFRAGLGLLFSPLWLRGMYSPALVSCLPPHFGAVLRHRMERCFARHPNYSNPYARALLVGWEPKTEGGPMPVTAASRIELVTDDAAAYLEHCPSATFEGLSLSNILDGAGPGYRERLIAAVRRAAKKNATVVQRSFGEPATDLRTNRAEDDRSMLWGIVDARPVEAL